MTWRLRLWQIKRRAFNCLFDLHDMYMYYSEGPDGECWRCNDCPYELCKEHGKWREVEDAELRWE